MSAFDSWEGFRNAGFQEESERVLSIRTDTASCRSERMRDDIRVSFRVTKDGAVIHAADFDFPVQVSAFPYWTALLARRLVCENAFKHAHEDPVHPQDGGCTGPHIEA